MDQAIEALERQYAAELETYPLSLTRDYQTALEQAARVLDKEQLRLWAEDGVAIARHSLRSWEAAAEYFRSTQPMLQILPFSSLRHWTSYGIELAEVSSALAAAYFRAAPDGLRHITLQQMHEWSALGKTLYKGTWKSSSLASQFFEVSSRLLGEVEIRDLRALVMFVDSLSSRSYELASACLAIAPRVLSDLSPADRAAFLNFADVIAEASWADARAYFEKGPALLRHVQSEQRPRFLVLAATVSRQAGRQAYPFFAESAAALGQIDAVLHQRLISLAETLASSSGPAAMEFLKSVPDVLLRVHFADLEAWHDEGLHILETNEDGGQAFFRLESGRGEEVLEALSSRVELTRVGEVLRMYCKALTGSNVSIQSATALAEKGVGWVSEERPTTEGTTVYLPQLIETTREREENFSIYKVYATHQAGHLEFRSFDFSFSRSGALLGNHRQGRASSSSPDKAALTDMERFFDLFDDRQLASDVFTIVEDARIDALLRLEYGGIKAPLARVQDRELDQRPLVEEMPLRQAMVENLIRVSLDGWQRVRWPGYLASVMQTAVGYLRAIQHPQARVEDAAEATIQLYELIMQLPNIRIERAEDWTQMGDEISPDMLPAGMEGAAQDAGMEETLAMVPNGEEEAYEGPDSVDFRGDFKPELVQLLMRLRAEQGDALADKQLIQLTAEQLQELLEKSVEIDMSELSEGDLMQSSDQLLNNLMKEVGTPPSNLRDRLQQGDGQSMGEEEGEQAPLPPQPQFFFYDEWDFRANDYKPRWCRVVQRTLDEGSDEFFRQTLSGFSGLMTQTRKQFELMKPELFRKIKRLYDGEELDLDATIEYVVERRTGHTPSDKVYWRRNKVERDVAVSFLLDMSASTDEEISRRERKPANDDFNDDPRRYLTWWAQKKAREASNPVKRIIDLEKESIVLLTEALETIGDTYGIFGFSGYGRENVEFYVIKDLNEPYGDRIKRRIDKIVPIRSTRMGPALRHTTAKLEQHDAKIKILFLISDGRPQDHGYGRDRTEKDYAIHDTRMALNEARRKGIVPFCLTVDRSGHDYLKTMCEDIAYEVVSDIESLPSRLPTLYRKLTE